MYKFWTHCKDMCCAFVFRELVSFNFRASEMRENQRDSNSIVYFIKLKVTLVGGHRLLILNCSKVVVFGGRERLPIHRN